MITDDNSGLGKLNSDDRNFHPWSIDESFSALFDVKDIYRSKGNNVRVFERRVKLDLDVAVVDLNVLNEFALSCIWGNLFQVYPPYTWPKWELESFCLVGWFLNVLVSN